MLQDDTSGFKGLHEFHGMLLDIAAKASQDNLEGVPNRQLMQAGNLGAVCTLLILCCR